jgi:hypothetical protein
MHEPTFRGAVFGSGMNPYLFDMCNIREQCSWVHVDRSEATEKAKDLIRSSVARANLLEPLEDRYADVTKAVMVVGAGISGIQAALDYAQPGARLVFSCGWHITRDGKDVYSASHRREEKLARWITKVVPFVDIDDQVEACRRIFASDTRWTVVRGSDLEEGESQGLPVWSRHVGDPVLASNKTRRTDFALFMVEALKNDGLIREAPAIVGCRTASALAHPAPRP